jgi:hypothetical protein
MMIDNREIIGGAFGMPNNLYDFCNLGEFWGWFQYQ